MQIESSAHARVSHRPRPRHRVLSIDFQALVQHTLLLASSLLHSLSLCVCVSASQQTFYANALVGQTCDALCLCCAVRFLSADGQR